MKIVKDNAKFRIHWPLLQISDYNKAHYMININHQTGNWNDQPRRSISALQMRPASLCQYFLPVPQIQSQIQISPIDAPCWPTSIFFIGPADQPRRLTSIFIISSTSLGLLTYYRSAPHFHLRIDLPHRYAPQILPTHLCPQKHGTKSNNWQAVIDASKTGPATKYHTTITGIHSINSKRAYH